MLVASKDTQIDDTGISLKWFARLLANKFQIAPEALLSVRGKRLDGGYMSTTASVRTEWQTINGSRLHSIRLVLKIPNREKMDEVNAHLAKHVGTDERNDVSDTLALSNRTECMLYELLSTPLAHELRLPIPRYYYGGPDFLVIEDLSDVAGTPDQENGLTLGQLKSLVRALAALHAYSFLAVPAWNADGHFTFCAREMRGWLADREIGRALRRLPEAAGVFVATDDELDQALDCGDVLERIANANRPVITHGDLWTNNTLYRKEADGAFSNELIAIVDWQTTHPGPAWEDLVRALTTSVNEQVRRKYEFAIIDEYFECLKNLLAASGLGPPFTVDELKRDYRIAMRYGVAILLMNVALTLFNPRLLTKYTHRQRVGLLRRVQAGIEDVLKNELSG